MVGFALSGPKVTRTAEICLLRWFEAAVRLESRYEERCFRRARFLSPTPSDRPHTRATRGTSPRARTLAARRRECASPRAVFPTAGRCRSRPRIYRKAIDRRHPRGFPVERPDEKPHMPNAPTVYVELANDLGLERILPRIKVRRRLGDRLRDVVRREQTERMVEESELSQRRSGLQEGSTVGLGVSDGFQTGRETFATVPSCSSSSSSQVNPPRCDRRRAGSTVDPDRPAGASRRPAMLPSRRASRRTWGQRPD